VTTRPPNHVYVVIAAAILAISAAGVLVRGAEGASPVTIALYRSAGVALLFSPFWVRPSRADAWRIGVAGVALAAHFTAWFASLEHTTVLRSTVLVTFTPLWVGLMEWGFFRSAPRWRFWPGILVGALGTATMVSDGGTGTLYGDGLAVLGGLLAAVYLITGRSVRSRMGIGPYAASVCAVSAACLLPVAVFSGTALAGFSTPTWLAIAGLTLGPQLIGHNGLNYALGWFDASTISALTLLEPIGATLLAAAVLGEIPAAWTGVGAVMALVGVAIAVGPSVRGQRRQGRGPAVPVHVDEDGP